MILAMISSADWRADRHVAGRAVRLAQPRHENPQVVVDLGDRADGAPRRVARVLLLDGDGRREALDVVHLRLLHLADELPGVGAEALDVAPLALGVDRVHGQRGLARAARAAADGQLVAGDVDVDVLEVVLPGAADLDERPNSASAGRGSRLGDRRALRWRVGRAVRSTSPQHFARCAMRSRKRRPCRSTWPVYDSLVARRRPRACRRRRCGRPPRPPPGPRSMIQSAVLMTSRLCSTTSTVLPASTKPCSTFKQQLDVGEVQAGGRLVEQVERPAGALLDQLAGELDPLGLAAGERGRGLAELHVVQPHVVQRLQLVADGRDVLEVRQRLLHVHLQHLGDRLALVADLQRLAVEAVPLAHRAGDPDVGQEVHLQPVRAVALAGLAAAAARR